MKKFTTFAAMLLTAFVATAVLRAQPPPDLTTMLTKFLVDLRAGTVGVNLPITSVAIGTSPASAGAIRIKNNTSIVWRNAANNGDVTAFTVDATNNLNILSAGGNATAFTGSVSTNGLMSILTGTAVPAGGATGSGFQMSSTTNLGVYFGSGLPTLSAAQGSLYIRTDGSSTSTRLYVNTNGSTGWTAITTAT